MAGISHLLTQTCTVASGPKKTRTSGTVKQVRSYASTTAGVACEVQGLSGGVRRGGDGETKQATHRWFGEETTVLKVGDHVRVTDGNHVDEFFEVMWVDRPKSRWTRARLFFRADLTESKPF